MEALLDKMENILGRVTEVEKKLDEKADVLTVSKLIERICDIEEHLKVTVPVSDESENHGAVLSKTVENIVNRHLGEDKDIETRRNNLILYRVPENNCKTQAEAKDQEMSFFERFCQDGLQIDMKGDDVAKIYRLGKKEDGKCRPLLVGLKNAEKKLTVMQNLKKLKVATDNFKSISVAHDLTPTQRQQVKQLIDQTKSQEATVSDDSENTKWIVVGQNSRKPRVRRLRKLDTAASSNQD